MSVLFELQVIQAANCLSNTRCNVCNCVQVITILLRICSQSLSALRVKLLSVMLVAVAARCKSTDANKLSVVAAQI